MTLYAEGQDGTLIAYAVHGEGRPVLLVHGFASNAAETWERTGWVKAVTNAGRRAITLDLRGHGQSDKPVDRDAYAIERLGADLAAVLDSALTPASEAVDVIAYSLGCRIASALTRLAPERVARLVLGGAGPSELFASWDRDEVEGMLLRGETPADPVIRAALGPALAPGADRDALAALVAGVAGAPLTAPGGTPVLFAAGENDPVPAGARELALDWGAQYVSIPGRDHVSTLTSRVFKDAAIGFLAGNGSPHSSSAGSVVGQ